MDAHWIFSGVLVLGAIWLVYVLMKKSKRCYVCMEATINGEKWAMQEPGILTSVLAGEQENRDLKKLEICPKCRKIYDEKWFKRDWDMSDRLCACGFKLKSPWRVDPQVLQRAVSELSPDAIRLLLTKMGRNDVAKFLGGYQDMVYRHDNLVKGHPLRVCNICFRIYTWIENGGYQVFRCVNRDTRESGQEKMID